MLLIGLTVIVMLVVSLPLLLLAIRLTVKAPAAEKTWVGSCSSELPPSPKSHSQAVGEPVDWSEKTTPSPALGLEGLKLKSAVGATRRAS